MDPGSIWNKLQNMYDVYIKTRLLHVPICSPPQKERGVMW
jgi:hypothetical protein